MRAAVVCGAECGLLESSGGVYEQRLVEKDPSARAAADARQRGWRKLCLPRS